MKKTLKNSIRTSPLKKTESKELTKRKLLDSALEIFSEYGFDAATTKLISNHSGVNESLINRYFEGKKGLFDAVISDYFKNKDIKADKYPAGKTVREEISNCLFAILEEYCQNLRALQLITSRLIIDKELRQIVKDTIEYPNTRLHKNLTAFQKKKIIRNDADLNLLQDVMMHFITGMINDKMLLNISKFEDYEVIDTMAEAFEKFIINPNLKVEKKKS